MAGPNIPTRVMMFRDFVPDRIRVFLCLLFALIFQFSGGIYLSSVSQMVGSTALMQEDIMMAGYASFVGMTVVFPILFRLKFRFTTRSILLFICPSLILCNIITMYTESLPVLVIFCFIAGVLRMWGTFEALSNVQLSVWTRNSIFGILGKLEIYASVHYRSAADYVGSCSHAYTSFPLYETYAAIRYRLVGGSIMVDIPAVADFCFRIRKVLRLVRFMADSDRHCNSCRILGYEHTPYAGNATSLHRTGSL